MKEIFYYHVSQFALENKAYRNFPAYNRTSFVREAVNANDLDALLNIQKFLVLSRDIYIITFANIFTFQQ